MPSRSVLVVVLLVLSLAVVGVTAARPPPEPLCGVCGDSLADSAADHGVSLSVAETDLSIHVDETGSSRWHVRFVLQSGADELGGNDRRRRAIIRDAFGTDVRSSLAGDTLVVTYPGSDFARRSADAVVVDSLTSPYLYLNADTLTIHAPPGYRLANHPSSGTTPNDSAVVWSGNDESGYFESTYIAFVPTDTFAPTLAGPYAIALAVGPMIVTASFWIAFFPMAMFGGASALLTLWQDGATARNERVSLVAALAAAGLFLVIALRSRNLSIGPLFGVLLLVSSSLFFGEGYHNHRDRRTWGFVVTLAIAPFLVVLVAAFFGTTGPVFGDGFSGLFFDIGGVIALVVGVVAFFAGRGIARSD